MNAVVSHVSTKWTFTQYKTFNEIVQIPHAGNKQMRLFSESPLIQSLTKKEKCPVVLLRSDDFVTFMLGTPPPLHSIIHTQKIIITSSVIAMFRCLLKVEV